MDFLGIILLVLVIFSLLSGGGGFYYSKSKNRGRTNTRRGQASPNDAFENNKRVWQFNTIKTISVPYFNYQENYNEFPFFSDYLETKEFLIKKGVSGKEINALLQTMEEHESNFLRIWSEHQRRLLRTFDQTRLGTTQSALMFLLQFYNHFLDAFRQEVINFLVNKILVAELGRTLGLNSQQVIKNANYQSYINEAVNSFNRQLNADVDQIINKLYQEIQAQFSQFFNQFNQQNRNQNQQQTAFQEEFDEIALAYKTLGVNAEIADDDLKKTYRSLAMKYHPDKNPSQEAKEKMAKINSAYDLVKKMRNIK